MKHKTTIKILISLLILVIMNNVCFAINNVYKPFLQSSKRFEIFYGGAGSGKSYFVSEKIVLQTLQPKLKNTMVVRKVARTNRDSTFALIKQVIRK